MCCSFGPEHVINMNNCEGNAQTVLIQRYLHAETLSFHAWKITL